MFKCNQKKKKICLRVKSFRKEEPGLDQESYNLNTIPFSTTCSLERPRQPTYAPRLNAHIPSHKAGMVLFGDASEGSVEVIRSGGHSGGASMAAGFSVQWESTGIHEDARSYLGTLRDWVYQSAIDEQRSLMWNQNSSQSAPSVFSANRLYYHMTENRLI